MRKVLVTLAVAVPLVVVVAPSASADCDPKYRPLCTNDCRLRPPDPTDPLEYFTRICPA